MPPRRSRSTSVRAAAARILTGASAQAVTHGDGPLARHGRPGTGKTEVITRRIAWLIASRRARPSEILALTFTERAADEMQARVDLLVPYGQADSNDPHLPRLRRLDAARVRASRSAARMIHASSAVPRRWCCCGTTSSNSGLERYRPLGDPTRFVGAVGRPLHARQGSRASARTICAAYANELDGGCAGRARPVDGGRRRDAPGPSRRGRWPCRAGGGLRGYQACCGARRSSTTATRSSEAVRLLEERPAVRMALRRRFRYVVVDEAQDANPQQLRLVRQLVGQERQRHVRRRR